MQRWTLRPCYIRTAAGPCLHGECGNVLMKTRSDIKEGLKKKKNLFISLWIHFRALASRISMSLLNWAKKEQWGKWTMPSCKECKNSLWHWCVCVSAPVCVRAQVSPCPHLHLIPVTPSDKLETSEQPKYSSGDKMYAAGDNTVWQRCGAEVALKAHRSQSQTTSSRGTRRRASWDKRRRRARIFMPKTGGRRTRSLTFAEEVRSSGVATAAVQRQRCGRGLLALSGNPGAVRHNLWEG